MAEPCKGHGRTGIHEVFSSAQASCSGIIAIAQQASQGVGSGIG